MENSAEDIRREKMAEGKAQGLAEGKEIGLQAGSQQKELDIIIAMLKNNADYEFISKVTNKSIKEIKEIEESMNDR